MHYETSFNRGKHISLGLGKYRKQLIDFGIGHEITEKITLHCVEYLYLICKFSK